MRTRSKKELVKQVLGRMPFTAELDWYLRMRGEPLPGLKLDRLKKELPNMQAQAESSPFRHQKGKKVFIFTTLHYWISHTTTLGLALGGLGHDVTLSFLPYYEWYTPANDFDLRRHNLYAKQVLNQAKPTIEVVSLLDHDSNENLPNKLIISLKEVSERDTQYTEQIEEIDLNSDLYHLRMRRNKFAAETTYRWMQENRPDVVITPNGLILEFGAVFETTRYLKIPVITYEFGEQQDRIWFSQDSPVMLQETNEMWNIRKDEPFSDQQLSEIEKLLSARQGASVWKNFSRQWQETPSEGKQQVREKLKLDSRPIVLLAANVIGDSLTLGRQVFTESMTEWLRKTVEYFADREDVQFILRIHPGERDLDGPSVADLIQNLYPQLPNHMRLITASDSINTYDLVSIADLGLVYTTTVGMELAMNGVPVIVVGNTHYRDKGFTYDPNSWEEYYSNLDKLLSSPKLIRLNKAQINQAWHYAYRFFFDYPRPFPWHLLYLWNNVESWPLSRVLSDEGQEKYGSTFQYLVGEPVDWSRN